MPEKKKSLYRTSDIYFSAYLCSVDLEMMTTENETGNDGRRKLVFVFRTDVDIGRLKASYFGGNGTVKVRKYVDNLKALKSMVYV